MELRITVQQAAANILLEHGEPLTSRKIAEIIIERQWIHSDAENPVLSFSQTLERNIRNAGGNPKLEFIRKDSVRMIALPNWCLTVNETLILPEETRNEVYHLEAYIPQALASKIKLFNLSIGGTWDDTIITLLKQGMIASKETLLAKLSSEFEDLE